MSKKLTETKKRKSKYDKNRSCYLAEDGSYVDEVVDLDTGAVRKERFVPEGEKAAELVIWLDEDDHQQDLSRRYDEENLDWEMENKRARFEKGTTEDEFDEDPFSQIKSNMSIPESTLFDEEETEDPRIVKLREFMKELTDDQVNLIYDLFGNLKTLREIAEESVKADGTHPTEQAIYGREQKILKRLRKMFEKSEQE